VTQAGITHPAAARQHPCHPHSTPPPSRPVDLIISADTVVEAKGRILEKPDDAAHAYIMLQG
jgi:predicted house-cleaning NTP pyrophosphatase (Maf/HAM1 superfamily)